MMSQKHKNCKGMSLYCQGIKSKHTVFCHFELKLTYFSLVRLVDLLILIVPLVIRYFCIHILDRKTYKPKGTYGLVVFLFSFFFFFFRKKNNDNNNVA